MPLYPYTTCTCTCRCRAVKALALNAPLFIQPFLETISRFSFYNVVRQAVPDFDYPLTVEKFPGVETASRLVQIESVSTKIMATMVQYEKFTTINVLFSSQYFICLDEISSDSSLFKYGQPNTSVFIGYMLQSID